MRNLFIIIVTALLFLASCGILNGDDLLCPSLYSDVCDIDDDRVELIKASKDGDIETVRKLLNKKENVEAINATVFHLGNHSALSAACENGHMEIVQLLSDKGAKAYTGGASESELNSIENNNGEIVKCPPDRQQS